MRNPPSSVVFSVHEDETLVAVEGSPKPVKGGMKVERRDEVKLGRMSLSENGIRNSYRLPTSSPGIRDSVLPDKP